MNYLMMTQRTRLLLYLSLLEAAFKGLHTKSDLAGICVYADLEYPGLWPAPRSLSGLAHGQQGVRPALLVKVAGQILSLLGRNPGCLPGRGLGGLHVVAVQVTKVMCSDLALGHLITLRRLFFMPQDTRASLPAW